MRKKVLFCATVDIHFKAFHLPYLKWFKDQGWEVHVAASGDLKLPYVDKKFNISIQRSPLNWRNLKAYKELKEIINENHYKIIHCHTPMGGVLTRLAAKQDRKQGAKVIYTAHGFHFCKGAPLLNWVLYYPIEKFLSRLTDCLITINKEDFYLVKKHQFRANIIQHVHGVGVNTEIFKPVDNARKNILRKSYGYTPSDFLMVYAAEFNKNKNQKLLIESLAHLKEEVPNARLILAGDGPLFQECKDLALNLGVDRMIDFLGYRTDMEVLLKICDIAVGSSLREGLPVNIMEAMACGLPVVASVNRGHKELIQNGLNGFIVSPKNPKYLALKLQELWQSNDLRKRMGLASENRMKNYSLFQVSQELTEIYSYYMEEVNETEGKHHRAYI